MADPEHIGVIVERVVRKMTISFHVPGEAVGKSMKTDRRTLKRYKRTSTREFMKLVADLARRVAPRKPWEGPICVEIEITRRLLKVSGPKQQAMLAGRILPTTKPDNDNVEKCVFDAMTGIIYIDDAQIVRNMTTKKYGTVEGTQITVSRWARGVRW